ncbi:Na+/H+ antiporter subunit E [Aquabacter spiritensis]|uniref:Multisubunit potassium/proton antiporter PhaE subunit n=1 Tax=Aquabacter spiritensis TaxID=933073 RepID=A0A4R3LYX9_9HYPH|nr:Na+/H+ antiporter subunit E [Aquabacter spiritensis]TCT05069.1 multisubunit potassium/proton antiporter PhaE subunit [Aquabacter spiritensis]
MRARFLPHPLLTVLVTLVFVFLMNEVTPGVVVLGLVLGLAIPLLTAPFWPGRPQLKAPLVIAEFMLIVMWDIVVSNIEVAKLILFRRGESLRSRFIRVPLDLRTPEAIAMLAGTITMTPGTVSADLSADGKALLVHCLDTGDPEATAASIKARYERRLKRIFE